MALEALVPFGPLRFGVVLPECVVVPELPRPGTCFGDLRKLQTAAAYMPTSQLPTV